jgi:hypothetical protein
MSTIANPVYQSLFPGAVPTNPVGTQIAVPGSASSSGSNPLLPSPGTSNSAPGSTNPLTAGFPTSPGSAVPTFGANTGAYPSTTNLGGVTTGGNPVSGVGDITSRQQGRSLGELQSMYGEGLGSLMYQFLQGGAGFNEGAVNNLLASLQPGIERGEENLMTQFSATGNRFGSGAEIGLGDYLSQVNLNEGQIVSQMYEQSIQNYLQTLTGASQESLQAKENSPGFFDYFQAAMTGAQRGAAAAAGAG